MAVNKKRVTIVDIAKKLGINDSTVSRALADSREVSAAMKDKIHKVAAEMGYIKNPTQENFPERIVIKALKARA